MTKGKTVLASLIIEKLPEYTRNPVLFFYCKHDQPGKNTFIGILRGLLVQLLCQDNALVSYIYDICSCKDQVGMSLMLEEAAETALDSQAISIIILDGLDECKPGEAEKAISWFTSHQKNTSKSNCGQTRLLCVGQRSDELQNALSLAREISLENIDHQRDVESYVKEQAQNIGKEFEISLEVQTELITRVTNASKSKKSGLFFPSFTLARAR